MSNVPTPERCGAAAEVRIDTPTISGCYCFECGTRLTNLGSPAGVDVLPAGAGRSCDGPGPSGAPSRQDIADVFGDDHPIIGEAVAWLNATDTVPLSRRMAENLLPHWMHYANLSDRERTGILNRFPVSVQSLDVAQGDCAISDLAVGDWFADPSREDNRPAKVVKILSIRDGRASFELDDYTRWGAWTGSYPLDATVKLIGADRGAQLDREAAETKAAEVEYRRRLDAHTDRERRYPDE